MNMRSTALISLVAVFTALTGCTSSGSDGGSGSDMLPPSAPAALTATAQSQSVIDLSWNASTDTGGSGLAGYRVMRGTTQVAQLASTALSYSDTGLTAATQYSYTVLAYDGAGNVSLSSNVATATTLSAADTTPPSVPQGLMASAQSASSISLSWSASTDSGGSGLAGYRVFRGSTQVAQLGSGTLTYLDTGLAASTSYSYTVRAYDGAGNESANSNVATATTQAPPDTTAPTVPQNLTATPQAASTTIALAWQASTDAGGSGLAGYRIKRGGTQIAQVAAGTLTYSDTGLAANTAYSYTVTAYDGAGNVSADSNTATATTNQPADTTAPTVPTNLTASPQSSTSISLAWSASTDAGGSGLAGYRVYRGAVNVGTVAAGTVTFVETGLSPTTAYSYTVRAYDGAGNVSANSNTATATTPADTTAPTVPANLTATAQSTSSIALSWSASTDSGGSGLAGYRILRGGTQIAQVGSGTLSFTDTSLAAGTAYSYNVRAYDNAGNVSANSNTATATTLADTTAPTVPQNLVATALTNTSIGLSWSASTDTGGSGLAGYRIFRGGTQIAQLGSGVLTYTNTGLTSSTAYSYTVRAYDGANNVSAPSNTASATTLAVGMTARPSNTSCIAPARPGSGGNLTLGQARILPNITFPTLLSGAAMPASSSTKWYVTSLEGHIYKVDNSDAATTYATFVDLSDRVVSGSELGLFGIAFHPNYPTNPRAYVSYTTGSSSTPTSRVSEFRTLDGGVTLDRTTEKVLLTINQPESNHNGGFIGFSPVDHYLYLGFGDGGGGGDAHGAIGNGQNTKTLLGKILRINVDATTGSVGYAIPADNPFIGSPANALCNVSGPSPGASDCPEIYAYGLRNPWRGSFDRLNGQLWVGDVGQNAWEEVDRINKGGNYGWRCREGAHDYLPNSCGGATNLLNPVAEYANTGGMAVIGGYVYRGSQYPGMYGTYVFADFNTTLYAVDSGATPTVTATPNSTIFNSVSSFAEDNNGEIYAVYYNGFLQKVTASGGGTNTIPNSLIATGCVSSSTPTQAASGMIPYAVNSPLWSDGAAKRRWIGLPNGASNLITTSGTNGDWSFPSGTVLMKDFLVNSQLVETRLFMRHTDGSWAGYTYEWNASLTDATRVVGGKTVTLPGGQSWHFPSEAECMLCHTGVAGYSLGLETAQLNGDFGYPATPSPPYTGQTANQIITLNNIGLLSPAITTPPASLAAYPNPLGSSGTVAERARAYLHANCSGCHRPGGTTPSSMDLRYQTAIASTNTCSAAPFDSLPIDGATKVIDPANPANSILYVRMHKRGANQMPPIASNLVDSSASAVVFDWISQMNASCQ